MSEENATHTDEIQFEINNEADEAKTRVQLEKKTHTEEIQHETENEADDAKANHRVSDGIIRFTSENKPLRKTVGYVIYKITSGETVTLQGYGNAMNKVITVAGIVRDRVGGVHQVCNFVHYEMKNSGKEGTGIQIILSTKDLDHEAIGYQKPELKGFWSSTTPVKEKRERRNSSKAPAGVKEAENEQKVERSKEKPKSARRRSAKKLAE